MKSLITCFFCICLSISSYAQVNVTGTVKDGSNDPIPGVTVMEKGTTNGVITDFDGKYTLKVTDEKAILAFSFVGMTSQEIAVGTQTEINVTMTDELTDLDEVVVVGYGVQKKKLTTGANLNVKGEDLQKLNTVDALGAIQSQAPGVTITQSSGMPGQGYNVNIRGIGTTGTSTPLYVIDGVAGGDITTLNPSDIESMDVLKDAASAAIYGARAANGVILVTTKQGKEGKVHVSYDGYYGVQNVFKMPSLLNAKQYMTVMNTIRFNEGLDEYNWEDLIPSLYEKIENGSWNGTNWLDAIRNKNAPMQNHAFNLTGGNEVSTFSLGLSYTKQDGILGKPVTPDYERYTARLNSDHIILKNDAFNIIKLGENLNYTYHDNAGIGIGNIYWNDIHNMLVACPLMPIYGDDGDYYDEEDKEADGLDDYYSSAYNPIADMVYTRGQNITKNYALNTSVYLEIQPLKNLIWKSRFGYKMSAYSYRSYVPSYELSSTVYSDEDATTQTMGMGYSWTLDNTLSYSYKLNNHSFDAVLGQSVEKSGMGEDLSFTNTENSFSDLDHAYISNTSGYDESNSSYSGDPYDLSRLASFFGRINYNYKEKYMATLVMRADGSSNFAEGHRWGYFPSASAGWVMTSESFMNSTQSWLDFFKLRASWGQNGNCDIDPYQYASTITWDDSNNYSFGNSKSSQSTGAYADINANEDLTWETSEQLDFGFDARFLHSRLGLTFDWYKKTTKDWLVDAPQLATYGTEAADINGGDVENKGIEIALNWNDKIGDLKYGVNLNMSFLSNKVTRIANSEGIIHGDEDVLSEGTDEMYRAEVGKPIGYFWGYKTKGVFQNQTQINNTKAFLQNNPEPGDLIFADTDGNGTIDEDDKCEIGNPNPDATLGFSFNLGYKGFDFSVTTNGAFGQQIAKSYRSFADSYQQNFTTEIFNAWHGEGTSNKLPRLTSGSNTNWVNISDIYIEDGDYLKLKNITLGYDFKNLVPKMFFSQARLYVTAQNLYTFTGYSGMDPEIGYGYDESWVSGIDLGFYPSARTYMVGVNLKF